MGLEDVRHRVQGEMVPWIQHGGYEMSKSELKRKCVMNPMDMAQEIIRLSALCEAKDVDHESAIVELTFALSEAQAQKAIQAEVLQEIKRDIYKLCEEKDAEIARLKDKIQSAVKDDFSELFDKLSEAQAQIAMKDEALKDALSELDTMHYARSMHYAQYKQLEYKLRDAISATPETVAAWKAKETEPLRREVAMQAEFINMVHEKYPLSVDDCIQCEKIQSATSKSVAAWRAKEAEPLRREVAMLRKALTEAGRNEPFVPYAKSKITEALTNTQATALAYEREVKAKALEDAAEWFECSPEVNSFRIRDILKKRTVDLRSNK